MTHPPVLYLPFEELECVDDERWAMPRLREAALPPFGPSPSSRSWAKPAAAIARAARDPLGLSVVAFLVALAVWS